MVQKTRLTHQLRLVLYPIIYKVLAPSQVVIARFLPTTVWLVLLLEQPGIEEILIIDALLVMFERFVLFFCCRHYLFRRHGISMWMLGWSWCFLPWNSVFEYYISWTTNWHATLQRSLEVCHPFNFVWSLSSMKLAFLENREGEICIMFSSLHPSWIVHRSQLYHRLHPWNLVQVWFE